MEGQLSEDQAMKPHFLSLPIEIREHIYSYLLQPVPWNPTSRSDLIGSHRSRITFDHFYRTYVCYQTRKLSQRIIFTLGLTTCCHQTRFEIQNFIQREDKNTFRDPIFRLDCIMQRERMPVNHITGIYPTWISLPTSLASVSRLEINIRVRHMLIKDSRAVILPKRIYELLHQLLIHGPHFYMRKDKPTPVKIDTLILKFTDERIEEPGEVNFPVSLERIEQCISGFERYGLLRGRVKLVHLRFGEYFKEILVRAGNSGRRKEASGSEWLAWVYRWPKDDMYSPLDALMR